MERRREGKGIKEKGGETRGGNGRRGEWMGEGKKGWRLRCQGKNYQ